MFNIFRNTFVFIVLIIEIADQDLALFSAFILKAQFLSKRKDFCKNPRRCFFFSHQNESSSFNRFSRTEQHRIIGK